MVRFDQTDLDLHLYLLLLLRPFTYILYVVSLSHSPHSSSWRSSPRHRGYSAIRSPFTTTMFTTRILTTAPRILVVKRTLATLPSTSGSASSAGPRLSTTNPVSVITGHHDSPFSSESSHHASYSNTPSEQATKKPYMVDGSLGGGFGGIPMGAFAVSTPFEQH